MMTIEGRMKELGRVASGPGRYALARGHLALGEPARARPHLEQAMALGYQTPAVSYALGRALVALYRAAHQDGEDDDPSLAVSATAHLRAGQVLPGEPQDLIRAWIALHERRYADAIGSAIWAESQAPWLYEAKILAGDVYLAMGELEEAGKSYRAAAHAGRSDPVVYERECWRLFRMAQTGAPREKIGLLYGAQSACEQARAADPQSASVYRLLSRHHGEKAETQRGAGRGALDSFTRATLMGDEAVRWQPDDERNWKTRGAAFRGKARYETASGGDARASLQRALESFQTAVALRPGDRAAEHDLEVARVELAELTS